MKHILVYKQTKDSIDMLVANGSNTYRSLIELFNELDHKFYTLIDEKTIMDSRRELAITASPLFDAYSMVEEVMVEYILLLTRIGMNEVNSDNKHSNISQYIEPAKDLIPSITLILDEVLYQISDFIELHKVFVYKGPDSLSDKDISTRMQINKKLCKIANLVHQKTKSRFDEITQEIKYLNSKIINQIMIMESVAVIQGGGYAAIIPGITIVAVGDTEEEAKENADIYMDADEKLEIVPCSNGIIQRLSVSGESIDEWDEVDGVIVLPEEYSEYTKFNS